MKRGAWWMAAGAAAVLIGAPEWASSAEDEDLAVVKRAMAARRPAGSPASRPATPGRVAARPARRVAEPQWFRVRISEGAGGSRLALNLPLSLVRVLGDDVRLDGDCKPARGGRCPRVADWLEALDSGQGLIEVKDGGAVVRVWVE